MVATQQARRHAGIYPVNHLPYAHGVTHRRTGHLAGRNGRIRRAWYRHRGVLLRIRRRCIAVDLSIVVYRNGQRRTVNRQRTIDVVELIVTRCQTAGRNRVATGIYGILCITTIDQRTTQHRTAFAIHKAHVAHTVTARVGLRIIGLRCTAHRHIQRCFADRAGGVIGIGHRVVIAVVTVVHGHTAHRHCLVTGARIGIGKGKGAARQRIAGKDLRAINRHSITVSRGRAIVGLRHVAAGDHQAGRCNCAVQGFAGQNIVAGRTARCIVQYVRRAIAQRIRHADLVATHILGSKGTAARNIQCFVTDQANQRPRHHRGRSRAIVDMVGNRRTGDRQHLLSNATRQTRYTLRRIVGRIDWRTVQRHAIQIHGLVRTGVGIGETGRQCAHVNAHVVAAVNTTQHRRTAYRRRGRTVIHLVGHGQARYRQRLGRNRAITRRHSRQNVVIQIRTAVRRKVTGGQAGRYLHGFDHILGGDQVGIGIATRGLRDRSALTRRKTRHHIAGIGQHGCAGLIVRLGLVAQANRQQLGINRTGQRFTGQLIVIGQTGRRIQAGRAIAQRVRCGHIARTTAGIGIQATARHVQRFITHQAAQRTGHNGCGIRTVIILGRYRRTGNR